MVEAITKTINKFGELLTDICKGDEEDEVYLIEETEIYCASSTTSESHARFPSNPRPSTGHI